MKKHAYLIIAHNNFYILEKLLMLLDDSSNDIFIHIDKKASNFDFDKFKRICNLSKVYYTKKRINVRWGTQSQVKTEMLLFKTSYNVNNDYTYYHLISGVDLPIKTQSYIHDFFEKNHQEFIFYKKELSSYDIERIKKYRIIIKNNTIRKYFYILQQKFKVNRLKNCKLEICKGYNWASLTASAVKMLIEREREILNLTFCSLCADEMYKQIFIKDTGLSVYTDKNGKTDDMRLVDWTRGDENHPYIYKSDDFDLLIHSDKLFARKFDENVDREIIDLVFNHLKYTKGEKNEN